MAKNNKPNSKGDSLDDEFNLDLDVNKPNEDTSGLDDFKFDDSSTPGGLVDLSIKPDDSVLGPALEDLGIDLLEKKKPSLEKQIMTEELGYSKKGRFYHNKSSAVILAKDTLEGHQVYIMFGYSFKDATPIGKTIKEIICKIGNQSKDLYSILEKLNSKYLQVEGRTALHIIRDKQYPRVAFGYRVEYNPDNEKTLKTQLIEITKESWKIHSQMKKELEACLSKEIGYIGGERALRLYIRAYEQLKESEPLKIQPTNEAVQEAQATYVNPGRSKSITKEKQPLYGHIIHFFSNLLPKKKPKRK